MGDLNRRLRDEMRDEHAAPDGHGRLLARVRRRQRGRRVRAAGLGMALTGLIAVSGYLTLRGGGPVVVGATPPASGSLSTAGSSVDPSPSDDPTSPPTPTPSDHPTDGSFPEAPPAVTVRYGDGSVQLQPYTYCYRSGCVDGSPREVPDVGSPDSVQVEFPLDGWSFTASFRPAGDDCGRIQTAAVTETYRAGSFVLEPVGYADVYVVTLFGEAEQGGDLFVSFRWTTPTDGPLPEPRAYLALLSNDDPVTSYGVELYVSNLATTPSSERAIITVRASNGREITFEAKGADRDCLPEGSVFWDGPDAKGLAAAELGPPPFTYEVELILDGVHHLATATWPDDEIEGEEPGVLLVFSPALPALGVSSSP